MTYSGTVVSINTTDHILIVKGKEGEKTFDVSNATTLGSVKPGHSVRVVCAEKNGKMVASSVRLIENTSYPNARPGLRCMVKHRLTPPLGFCDQGLIPPFPLATAILIL